MCNSGVRCLLAAKIKWEEERKLPFQSSKKPFQMWKGIQVPTKVPRLNRKTGYEKSMELLSKNPSALYSLLSYNQAENEDAAAQDVEGHDSRAQHAGSHNDTAQDAEHHCGAGQGGDLGTGKETENGGARPKDEKEELCASEDRDIRAITSIEVSDTVKLLIEVRVKIEAVNQRTKM